MKPASLLHSVSLAATALSSASAASLRVTCEYAPTPAPTPAPTTLEDPIKYFDANGVYIRSANVPQLDKCYSWDGCLGPRDVGTIEWKPLGSAGTTIQFYKTRKCEGEEFQAFPADVAKAFTSPDITDYHTFVVRSSLEASIDRSEAYGCQK